MLWPGRKRGDGKGGGGGGGEAMSEKSFLQAQSSGKLSIQGSSGRKGRSGPGPTGSPLIWDFDLNVAGSLGMGWKEPEMWNDPHAKVDFQGTTERMRQVGIVRLAVIQQIITTAALFRAAGDIFKVKINKLVPESVPPTVDALNTIVANTNVYHLSIQSASQLPPPPKKKNKTLSLVSSVDTDVE